MDNTPQSHAELADKANNISVLRRMADYCHPVERTAIEWAAAALIAADKREREIEKLTLDANRLWRWGRDGAIYVRLGDPERILNTGSEAKE